MRELQSTLYSSETYSDENMLMNFKLLDPVTIKKNLTYLWGKDSQRFPLLSLTEGNGSIKSLKPQKLNDTQYTWDVMGRMKHTSKVVGLFNASITEAGLNYQEFQVIFEDNWMIKDYGVFAPDGTWQGRIQGEPEQIGENRFKYTLVGQSADKNMFCPLANFDTGKAWVMSAPTIAASKSDGNRSNTMAPGKMTNQFGFHRFSKNIAGNIANKVTPIQFELEGGGTTNMWMPFEMKQFEMDKRQFLEEDLWTSEYNRDDKGVIHLKDPVTGEPIPRGAGVKQIVKSVGNYDTFSNLTLQKVDNIMNAIFDNRVDATPTEIVLYTGKGGRRMWHRAIEQDALAKQFFTPLGEHVISGGDSLSYGKYFDQYKTIDGRLVTVKESNLFDHGLIAEMQKANGEMYMGLPVNSYTMVFLDHSRTDDGNRNIELVAEEGRESLIGVYKGMSPIPGAWGSFNNQISTRVDVASYENISSQGVNMTNPTTSFWLDFEL